jgi:hypothetical protein
LRTIHAPGTEAPHPQIIRHHGIDLKNPFTMSNMVAALELLIARS